MEKKLNREINYLESKYMSFPPLEMKLKPRNHSIRASLTSAGGPIAPVYVHGLLAEAKFEWSSKEGNLNFSTSSTEVVVDVNGDVGDKTH